MLSVLMRNRKLCFSRNPTAVDAFMWRLAESKLCRFVCRCHGYVYTYRLYQDHGGSWTADVRHFIVFSLSTAPASTRGKKARFSLWLLFRCVFVPMQPNLASSEQENKSSKVSTFFFFIFLLAPLMFVSLNEDTKVKLHNSCRSKL